jgi:hypothetical protein
MPLIAMGIIFIMIIYLFQGTTAYMQGITSETAKNQVEIARQNGQIIDLLNKQLGIVSPGSQAAAVTTPPPGVSAPTNP